MRILGFTKAPLMWYGMLTICGDQLQTYGSGEGPDMSKGGQFGSRGMQSGPAEPVYKKSKLAHLRVKVPGGVRTPPPPFPQTLLPLPFLPFSRACTAHT